MLELYFNGYNDCKYTLPDVARHKLGLSLVINLMNRDAVSEYIQVSMSMEIQKCYSIP